MDKQAEKCGLLHVQSVSCPIEYGVCGTWVVVEEIASLFVTNDAIVLAGDDENWLFKRRG